MERDLQLSNISDDGPVGWRGQPPPVRGGRRGSEPMPPDDPTPFASADVLFTPLGDRAGQLGESIRAQRLEAIVLTSPESVYYTTGYPTLPSAGNPILYALRNRLPPFAIVTAEGEISLGCWGFSVEGVALSVDRVVPFSDLAGALRALCAAVGERVPGPLGRVGIESTCPHFITEALRNQVGPEKLVVADRIVGDARLIKSPQEIECLARSLAIVEQAVTGLYAELDLGVSRVALMEHAKRALLANGANGVGHVTFTFGTTNPEIALDEQLQPDQLVVLDLGAVVDGYCSDNRRYAYAGEVPASLVEQHEAMVQIVDAVGEHLIPGTPYAEIQDLTRSLYREHGVPLLPRFTHAGHNIGLETEEEWLVDNTESTIRSGMVINIELYSLTATGQQIGDEETYVIEARPRRISELPRAIRGV
jgi:Xaa-Pro aminopeptidase